MATIVACSTAKKISLGEGSTEQLPSNARKLSIDEFNAENGKFKFPITPLDNQYIADNVLIAFHNVRNIAPNERSLEQMKKDIEGDPVNFPNAHKTAANRMRIETVNNTRILTWRTKGKDLIRVLFFCNNATNKLAVNGEIQAILSDSIKVDKDAEFIVKYIKFSE